MPLVARALGGQVAQQITEGTVTDMALPAAPDDDPIPDEWEARKQWLLLRLPPQTAARTVELHHKAFLAEQIISSAMQRRLDAFRNVIATQTPEQQTFFLESLQRDSS